MSCVLWWVSAVGRTNEQIILHRGLMYNAAWIEAWAVLGLATRCLLPMGLAARNSHS